MPSLISWFIFTHLVYMYIYYTNNPIVRLLPNHQLSYPSVIKHGVLDNSPIAWQDTSPTHSSTMFPVKAPFRSLISLAMRASPPYLPPLAGSYEHRRPVESMPWPWRCDGGFGPRACRGATAPGGDFWAEGRWDFWWNLMDSIEIKHHLYHPRKPFWKPIFLSD